ncbi:MAG: GAF domain-containing protein [Deltaproteobacteria bacterium]|nr:GAF domain-containing protein [Deltaproteobacteria bacterium]
MVERDHKAAYILDVAEMTRKYLRELQQENERLRSLLAASDSERKQLYVEIRDLRRQRDIQINNHLGLNKEELARLEQENLNATQRYLSLEQKNAHLANLYVASYRLHETLSSDEVLSIMQEIVINLIGCEQHSIYEVNTNAKTLKYLAGMGVDKEQVNNIAIVDDPIAQALREGKVFVASEAPLPMAGHPYPVTACVPLRIIDKTIGAVVLYRLLPQKAGIEAIDRELFELLAVHAGMALYTTKLHKTVADS